MSENKTSDKKIPSSYGSAAVAPDPLRMVDVGAECSTCGFRYWAHNGHIIPCPLCALSARGISAELLEIIRHNESVDDNGDPVGGKPETSWELGYAAGIRCLYRFLSKAANSSYVNCQSTNEKK